MSEAVLSADPDFHDLALDEWRQLADSPPSPPLALAAGVYLVSTAGSYWPLAQKWLERPPIFARHVFPVQAKWALDGAPADLDRLRQEAGPEFGDLLDPELPFSVQTRLLAELPYKPFDVNHMMAKLLHEASGAPLDVRAPQQILSVVVAQPETELLAYLGLSPAALNLSDWAGGVRRFARDKEQISRSEFKLLEALELFGVSLPARGRALDLGAAPGGWTRVLRLHEQYVTAVDPGELHPRLAADSNVRHLKMTAEAYLRQGPDRYDLIVNDMRLDGRDSARLMVGYAPFLYRDGLAIMTLKLPENGREAVLDHAFNIVRQAYTIAGARQLFHNRSEITLYLRPNSATHPPAAGGTEQ
jgi:23S rRNA (cytidine2498-2'-O)-methyltransferase